MEEEAIYSAVTEADALAALKEAVGVPEIGVRPPGTFTFTELMEVWHIGKNTLRGLLEAAVKSGKVERVEVWTKDRIGRNVRAWVYRQSKEGD